MSKISEYLSKKHNKDIKIFVVLFNASHVNKIKTLKSLVKIAKSEHRYDIANRVNNFLDKAKV